MWNKRGVSLYIAIAIMAILLASVLGIGGILLSQFRAMRGIENSVITFYAADSGIERALRDWIDPLYLDGTSDSVGGANYTLTVLSTADAGCSADNFCIISVGTYQETRRAIRVEY